MTTAGKLAKWLGVPVALLIVGRFIVGPLLLPKMPTTITNQAGEILADIKAKVNTIQHPGSAQGHSRPATPSNEVNPESNSAAANDNVAVTQTSTGHDSSEGDQSGGPEVEVSVHSERPSSSRRTPRHHKPSHPAAKKPKPKTETSDPGSFGGTQDPPTTTTGGTTDPPTGN